MKSSESSLVSNGVPVRISPDILNVLKPRKHDSEGLGSPELEPQHSSPSNDAASIDLNLNQKKIKNDPPNQPESFKKHSKSDPRGLPERSRSPPRDLQDAKRLQKTPRSPPGIHFHLSRVTFLRVWDNLGIEKATPKRQRQRQNDNDNEHDDNELTLGRFEDHGRKTITNTRQHQNGRDERGSAGPRRVLNYWKQNPKAAKHRLNPQKLPLSPL